MRAYADRHGLTLVGWVLGQAAGVAEVAVHASSGQVIRAPVDVPRPDIVEAFGDVTNAARSGFRIELEPDDFGESELLVRVVLSPRQEVLLGTARVSVYPRSRGKAVLKALFGRPRNRGRPPLKWTVLSPPAERHKVLRGQDEWLFLHRDPNDVIGQHTGQVRLNRRKRRAWADLLRKRLATVEPIGSVWLCAVIPDKNFVYPEHLPAEVVPSERRLLDEFLDLSNGVGAPVVYCLDDLQKAKQRGQLYSKTDTHWNHLGAYVGYLGICRALADSRAAIRPLPEAAIEWRSEVVPGDLGSKLYPHATGITVRAGLAAHKATQVFDNRVENHGRVIVFEQDWPEGPTCVVFGESFVQNLLLFLKESFRRLVFVHTSMLVSEVLEVERPDVVLTVPLERFLARIPDDHNAFGELTQTVRKKVDLGRLRAEAEPFLNGTPKSLECGGAEQVGTLPWLAAPRDASGSLVALEASRR